MASCARVGNRAVLRRLTIGAWSLYIFSSGGSLNQCRIGGLETEGREQCRLLRQFLS
jgi:hypothetical protein